MSISIWDKPAELKLTPMPFEAIAAAGAAKQKQWDDGETALGTLQDEFSKIKSIDIDTPEKIAELRGYQDKVKDLISKSGGDFSKMTSGFKAIQRDFNYNKNYGKLSGILNRYASQQESIEAKKKALEEFVKTGGEKGMSPEDVQATLNFEISNQAPLALDPTTQSWSPYKSESVRPTIDFNKKALEYASKITPTKVAQYAAGKELTEDSRFPGVYFNRANSTLTYSTADLRAQMIADAMKTDPLVTDYLNYKNRITKVPDKIKSTINQIVGSPENNYVGVDVSNGKEVTYSPEGAVQTANQIAESMTYKPIYDAAKSVGTLTQVHQEDPSLSLSDNWWFREQYKKNEETKSKALVTFPQPAVPNVNIMQDMPTKVALNTDGSVLNGNADVNDSYISVKLKQGIASLKGAWEGILAAVNAAPNSPFYNIPGAVEHMQKGQESLAYANMDANAAALKLNKQETTNASAEELRVKFPELAKDFPVNMKTDSKGKLYDANAGKLVNAVVDATERGQTVIYSTMVPSDPSLTETIQKAYFNTGLFNQLSFELANGKEGTNQEALNAMGYQQGIPQQALDKAKFTGFGGFQDPGAMYVEIPGGSPIPGGTGPMHTLVVKPDNVTKQFYTHSNVASKVYKTNVPQAQIQTVINAKTNTIVNHYFEYTPSMTKNADGSYSRGIQIKEYDLTKDGKKGTYLGSTDAMQQYQIEFANWLNYNHFSLK